MDRLLDFQTKQSASPERLQAEERQVRVTTLVLDTETHDVVEPEIVEAAWYELESPALTVAGHFCQRYRPSKPIALDALAAHHIMDEDLVNEPPSSSFKLPEDATILIGWNVDFDWQVIGSPKLRRIDVMAMFWRTWPEVGKVSQGAALYHVDRAGARAALQDAHSALQDCRNCLTILRAIAEKVGGFESWKTMWEYSEEARVPDTFMFGKHKGVKIADAPADYIDWFLRQPEVDPYLRKALLRAGRRPPEPEGDPYG